MRCCRWRFAGTPDQVLRAYEARRELLGDFELNSSFRFGGIPLAKAEASMRLFAKEVLPVLKGWKPAAPGADVASSGSGSTAAFTPDARPFSDQSSPPTRDGAIRVLSLWGAKRRGNPGRSAQLGRDCFASLAMTGAHRRA